MRRFQHLGHPAFAAGECYHTHMHNALHQLSHICTNSASNGWIHACRPLAHTAEIEERLQVVDLFKHRPDIRDNLQSGLAGLPDLPRLMTKAAAALDSLTAHVSKYTLIALSM
jgi:DNA mismatch repair ATPase MutS